MKRARYLVSIFALFFVMIPPNVATAQSSQYPLIDKLADKVIAQYQNSSCAQLAAKKGQTPTGEKATIEEHTIQYLHQNPAAAKYFINKVASPVANKMFSCGMIP